MAGYLEHVERWRHHKAPRVPDCHWNRAKDALHGGTEPSKCPECAGEAS